MYSGRPVEFCTGKTTYLSRQIERACEEYSALSVMACSFTRAAVAELNRRDLPIPDENLGTLHALAYRSLDHPEICETGKHLKEFSAEYPRYAISGGTRDDVDDGYVNGAEGDGEELLMDYARLRALMRPRHLWRAEVQAFAQVWEDYKQETGSMDFTDLIEVAIREVDRPKCYPLVGFFDEVQDFTPLELALVRKWGQTMEQTVLCYDLDQSIYGFKGADPASLYDPGLQPIILKQSYRVPRAVQVVSEQLIGQIQERHQREYLPREEEGEVLHIPYTFKDVEPLADIANTYLEQMRSVVLLTTCSYMLVPLITYLREQGVPFSNPYRRRRRDWNPLHKTKKQSGAAVRVGAFMAAFSRPQETWTVEELSLWLEMTKGLTQRKWKEYMESLPKETLLPIVDLTGILEVEDIVAAQRGRASWLKDKLNATWRGTATYALTCARRNPVSLVEEPLLRLGTIHSYKGGEEDVVILCPDLSYSGFQQLKGTREGRDAIIRQFYVATTRSRESLILASPSGRLHMPWWV